MICSKCGAEIKEGLLYCSICGEEAQIISEEFVLEDELLRQIIDEEDSSIPEEYGIEDANKPEQSPSDEDLEEYRRKRRQERKRLEKRRKKIRAVIIIIVIIVIAIAALFGYTKYQQMHSVDYLMSKAQQLYSERNYQSSLDYLDKVLDLEHDHVEALTLLGMIDAETKNYAEAEEALTKVLSLDPTCKSAYQYLILVYEKQDRIDDIYALMDSVEDEEILALFSDYSVPVPVLSKESGDYKEFFEVTATVPKGNYVIYYTLDGTTPTKEDLLYDKKIEMKEPGEITLTVICMAENGRYSKPVTAVYNIEPEIPDMPVASPDSGRFTKETTITIQVPEGCTAYYTWDGSEPTEKSKKYKNPITVPEGNNILSVVAIGENGMSSEILKCNYIYYPEKKSEPKEQEVESNGPDTSNDVVAPDLVTKEEEI